jgi:hypothetical protein
MVKRPGREADHSVPSSAEVKNEYSYTATPPHSFMTWTGETSPLTIWILSSHLRLSPKWHFPFWKNKLVLNKSVSRTKTALVIQPTEIQGKVASFSSHFAPFLHPDHVKCWICVCIFHVARFRISAVTWKLLWYQNDIHTYTPVTHTLTEPPPVTQTRTYMINSLT